MQFHEKDRGPTEVQLLLEVTAEGPRQVELMGITINNILVIVET